MLAAGQRAAAMPEPEERVELLDQLGGGRSPPHRPDAHGVPRGGLGGDLENRERDVQAAADVDVTVGVALAADVAGRPERLDQAVLEQQGAELGLRHLVIDVLGLGGPGGAAREVRPRSRAQIDRLADVQRPPVRVAEHVDTGLVRERGEVRALATGPFGHGRRARADAARVEQAERVADRRRVRREAPEERAEDPRARARVRQRAVDLVDLDPQRTRRASRGLFAAAGAGSVARAGRCTSPAGPATRAPRARTPGAARARQSPRCGPRARGCAAGWRAGAARPQGPAPCRPSPARCR